MFGSSLGCTRFFILRDLEKEIIKKKKKTFLKLFVLHATYKRKKRGRGIR